MCNTATINNIQETSETSSITSVREEFETESIVDSEAEPDNFIDVINEEIE